MTPLDEPNIEESKEHTRAFFGDYFVENFFMDRDKNRFYRHESIMIDEECSVDLIVEDNFFDNNLKHLNWHSLLKIK